MPDREPKPPQPAEVSVMSENCDQFFRHQVELADRWIMDKRMSVLDAVGIFTILVHQYQHKTIASMMQIELKKQEQKIEVASGPLPPELKIRAHGRPNC